MEFLNGASMENELKAMLNRSPAILSVPDID
jgi:hypothetical protein